MPLQPKKPKKSPKKPKEIYHELRESTSAMYNENCREARDEIYSLNMPESDEDSRVWLDGYINIQEVLRSPPPYLDSSKVFKPFAYEAIEMLYSIGLHTLPKDMSWDTYIRTPHFKDGPTILSSQILIRAVLIDKDSIIPFFEAISQVKMVPDFKLFIDMSYTRKSVTGLKSWPKPYSPTSPWPSKSFHTGWTGPLSLIASESSDGDKLREIGKDWTVCIYSFPWWIHK